MEFEASTVSDARRGPSALPISRIATDQALPEFQKV